MNLPNVTDLNKVDQTTNVCIINNANSTNLPTKFTEKMIRTFQMWLIWRKLIKLPSKTKMIRTTYQPSFQKLMIRTYQMWLIWRNLIKLSMNVSLKSWFDQLTYQGYRKQWYELTKCDYFKESWSNYQWIYHEQSWFDQHTYQVYRR